MQLVDLGEDVDTVVEGLYRQLQRCLAALPFTCRAMMSSSLCSRRAQALANLLTPILLDM